MNKYLLLSAAAVLATAGTAASAAEESKSGSASVYQVSGTGVTYCDADQLAWTKTNYYTYIDNETAYCGYSTNGIGQGIAGNTKKIGNNVDVSDVFAGGSVAINLDFSTPIKNGGTWALYYNSGYSSIEINSGNYYKGAPAAVKSGAHKVANRTVAEAAAKQHKKS